MIVTLNGVPTTLEDGETLDALIARVAGSTRGSAAAVDGEIVPRGEWAACHLRPGQSIELITAVQGG